MKYAIIGDLHGCVIYLRRIIKKLKKCDAIFITGDIAGTISYTLILKSIFRSRKISRERYTELVYDDYLEKFTSFQIKTSKRVFKLLEKLEKPVFFTHGNSETKEVRAYFEKISEEKSNLFYVGNSIKLIDKITVVGYGFCSPAEYRTPLQTPGEKEKKEIKTDLIKLEQLFHETSFKNKKVNIGLFHEPPYATKLDYIPIKSAHGGSDLIREHISKIPYDFIFVGHIHESQNCDQIGVTLAVNPGALVDRKYAILESDNLQVDFLKIRIPLSFKEYIYRTRTTFA